jgi:hypothetical protein
MTNPLYGIDAAGHTLAEIPGASPNFRTYSLRSKATNGTFLDTAQNFTGQDQAILYVSARGHSLSGYSTSYSLDMRIENVSFLPSGSSSSIVIPAVGASSTSFAPVWSADMEDPPIWAVGGYALSMVGGFSPVDLQVVVDICMVPASQIPLLEV